MCIRRLVAITVGAVLVAGCTPSRPVRGTGTVSPSVPSAATTTVAASTTTVAAPSTPPPTSAPETPVDGAAYEVASLGLTFRLPNDFRATDSSDLLFSARSTNRRSLITIASDSARVTEYDMRPGETISELDLGTDAALVVTNAALDGLPSGLSVNELLVLNGERSFSLIMSAPTSILPELWADFIDSIGVSDSVTPDA